MKNLRFNLDFFDVTFICDKDTSLHFLSLLSLGRFVLLHIYADVRDREYGLDLCRYENRSLLSIAYRKRLITINMCYRLFFITVKPATK